MLCVHGTPVYGSPGFYGVRNRQCSSAILDLGLPWSTLIQVSFRRLQECTYRGSAVYFLGAGNVTWWYCRALVNMTTAFGRALAWRARDWHGVGDGLFCCILRVILAAITAVGTIMMPKMIDQGYPAPFVIVLAAAAALLEALIPPSNAAIVFSALTNIPVSKTFAAGIIPDWY
ncbi:MAG: hypothetical protein CM1200mP18_21980 [Gammaproteobacteria bacterium]|nr:MAG: hypothetical protein CM1200mP18_21980 [Gammaproteobacteria bacterium]